MSLVESKIDAFSKAQIGREIIKPESSDFLTGIKSDLVLGDLDNAQINYCRQIAEIVGFIEVLDELTDEERLEVMKPFLYDEFHLIALSRSKNGLQIKLLFENIYKQFVENKEQPTKGFMASIMGKKWT